MTLCALALLLQHSSYTITLPLSTLFEYSFALLSQSTLTTEVTPSFILLAIQGVKVVTYVYELHGDQVDVSKSEFSKAT